MAVPESLTEKMDLFRLNGQIFREDDELFTETSWAAVMMGQRLPMDGHNVMADALVTPKTKGELDEMEKSIRFLVQQMPEHKTYLQSYCRSEAQ